MKGATAKGIVEHFKPNPLVDLLIPTFYVKFQEKIQSLEKKLKTNRDSSETWQLEKQRLTAITEEKSSIIEQLKKEQQNHFEQIDYMHKEVSY